MWGASRFLHSSVASRVGMGGWGWGWGRQRAEQLWPPPGKGFSPGDHPAGRHCLPSPQCPLWGALGLGSKQRVCSLSPRTALLPQVLEGRLSLTRSIPAGILPGSCCRGLLRGQLLWDTRTTNFSATVTACPLPKCPGGWCGWVLLTTPCDMFVGWKAPSL